MKGQFATDKVVTSQKKHMHYYNSSCQPKFQSN